MEPPQAKLREWEPRAVTTEEFHIERRRDGIEPDPVVYQR